MRDWLNSWRMCRAMCHEQGSVCTFPLTWAWSRIRKRRKRQVLYSQEFVSQVLEMQWDEATK